MLYSLSIQTLMMITIFVFFNPIVMAIGHLVMGILGGIMWMTMDTWVNIVSDNKFLVQKNSLAMINEKKIKPIEFNIKNLY